MADFWNKTVDYFSDADRWLTWSGIALKLLLILVIGRIAIRLLNKSVKHMLERNHRPRFSPRRTTTIIRLVGNIVKYVIHFVMILMILGELGVPYGPLLAGAGVFGLAVGFGAQSLVKDIITGFFIIFEDQFAVGDVIQTRSFKGTVEEIGLRVTRIRSWTGEVHVIPNGSITEVTNYSVHNAIALVDVAIPRSRDIDKLIERIGAAAFRAAERDDNAVQQPQVLGVQSMSANDVTIRVICECKPHTADSVMRKLNEEIRRSLDTNRESEADQP